MNDTPNSPVWLDADTLEDAPLTRNGSMFADGVRELQEPRSRVRCRVSFGIPAEQPVKPTDPRHGVTERIRASLARQPA